MDNVVRGLVNPIHFSDFLTFTVKLLVSTFKREKYDVI